MIDKYKWFEEEEEDKVGEGEEAEMRVDYDAMCEYLWVKTSIWLKGFKEREILLLK